LTTVYPMLKNGTLYQDLGVNHFHRQQEQRPVLRLVNRLDLLGYDVKISPRLLEEVVTFQGTT
jgi:hypothetical protein